MGIVVQIDSPPRNSTVGRRVHLAGQAGADEILGTIDIQFGAGGPVVPAIGTFAWHWDGLLPNNIRPGQTFQIIVSGFGKTFVGFDPEGEPIYEFGSGSDTITLVLENVVPALTVDPFQSPIVVTDAPHTFPFSGTATEGGGPDYGVTAVQYQVGSGALSSASRSGNNWSFQVALPPGTHTLTIQALDAYATVTAVQRTLTVHRFPMPAIPPGATLTAAGVPTTSSVTTWTRLEPQCAGTDFGASTAARVFDPIWFLTRQWQVGEFQGEDTGSPVQARVRATSAMLSRHRLGEVPVPSLPPAPPPPPLAATPYDPTRAPLETLVERRRMRPAGVDDLRLLRTTVEAGLHFLRMLDANTTAKKYRPQFLVTYWMRSPPPGSRDDATSRFLSTTVGRAPDARRLAAAFRTTDGAPIVFDPVLTITTADAPAVRQVATAWLAWYDALFSEPASPAEDAWVPARLEYAVSVAARFSATESDAVTFSASEFDGGRLDWNSFDVNPRVTLDTTGDQSFAAMSERTVPSPVTFHGMPAARFWEMEDAKVAYGLLPVGPTDLAHLMMIEYASTYGNDWYLIPLTIPVGSVTRIESLVVTDTFGVRSLLRPIGDPGLPAPFFSMWQPSRRRYPGAAFEPAVPNRFFLPPALGRAVDGAPVEEVLFLRDEMANLAWAIERTLEGSTGQPVAIRDGVAASDGSGLPHPPGDAFPRYLLSSTVPSNWIPLLPVQIDYFGNGVPIELLERGAVLQPDGSRQVHQARSDALNAAANLLIYDEEVPREGVRITRRRRMTRWTDGSLWVWTAFRNDVGRGEGSAALVFDQVLDESDH